MRGKCKILSLSTETLRDLSGYFSKHPSILSAWLFGSQASGRARPDSDVDLAVLTRAPLGWNDLSTLYVDLMALLDRDRIDIVELLKAPPILAFEAISGRELCRKDLQAHLDFVSLTSRRYAEVMQRLDRQNEERASLKAVLGTSEL